MIWNWFTPKVAGEQINCIYCAACLRACDALRQYVIKSLETQVHGLLSPWAIHRNSHVRDCTRAVIINLRVNCFIWSQWSRLLCQMVADPISAFISDNSITFSFFPSANRIVLMRVSRKRISSRFCSNVNWLRQLPVDYGWNMSAKMIISQADSRGVDMVVNGARRRP